jgi:putative membrane protein
MLKVTAQRSAEDEVGKMMGWYGGGMGLAAWLFMGLFWVALLALILWLVVRLLPARDRLAPSGYDSPEEILDRRFARGEIDEPTYTAQRAALANNRGQRR